MAESSKQRIGFEIEYIGVDLETTAQIISELFKGETQGVNTKAIKVKTYLGHFKVEKDAQLLQNLAEKSKINRENTALDLEGYAEDFLSTLLKNFVPNEIVCPPIVVNDIHQLNPLIEQLRNSGAKGTSHSLAYAFGLHINPEVSSFDPNYILSHIRAFIGLYPWIKHEMNIDITRTVSQYIQPYPALYALKVMNKDYAPSLTTLMEDYVKYVPDRNFALDLYPLFKHIRKNEDCEYFNNLLIKARPTFHFRMPNCKIDQANWSLETEYHYWKTIETIAMSNSKLDQIIALYHDHRSQFDQMPWIQKIQSLVNTK